MKKLFALLVCLAMVLSLAACGNAPEPTTPSTAPTGGSATLPPAPSTEPTTEPTEPPMTAEKVYAQVQQSMQMNQATRMRMELGFGVRYEEGETEEEAVTTEIAYNMVVDTIVSTEPFGSYATSSVAFDTEAFDMTIDVNVYMVNEDGYVVTYTQAFGSWIRSETGMTVEEFINSDQMTEIDTNEVWAGGEMPEGMTLDEATQILDGTKVYLLRTALPADGMAEALLEMGVELDENADVILMPVIYYVDAQNYTILRMEADMTVLTELMSAAMAESLLGSEAEAGDVTMEISSAIYDLGYGPQEIPALPQEALDQDYEDDPSEDPSYVLPVAGEASDLGNGSFVLPCGSEAFTITCPEDWTGEVYSTNNIWIYNEDQSLYGDFYYLTTWTEQDIKDQIQQDADELKNLDIFVSSGNGPAYLGFTTMEVIGIGESYCYAWTPIGEGYFLVILGDFSAEPDFEPMLNELLGLVNPYTGEFVAAPPVAEDLGNGSFSLPCGSQSVIITCPDGWSGEVFSENNIWLYNDNDYSYGDYYYMDGWTTEDVELYWIQSDIDYLKDEGNFISIESADFDIYTVKVLVGKDVSNYYAYVPFGEGCLLLSIYDYDGGNDSAELLPLLTDCITYE